MRGVPALIEGGAEQRSGPVSGLYDRLSFGEGGSKRLLAKHRHAVGQATFDRFAMRMIRCRDIDGVKVL